MNPPIDPESLKALLASGSPPPVLHLLPEADFEEARIPGALNFCVYESTFIEKVTQALPDKEKALVVYGRDDRTREAETAVAKLTAAGYTHVAALKGGIEAWRAAGGAVEGSGAHEEPALTGTFALDVAHSSIFWTGRNLFNHHHGSVSLASGVINLVAGEVVSAKFIIDMQSITCADISDPALNAMLIAHLKSDDFFAVDQHPSAEFKTTSVTPIEGCTEGTVNHQITGQFTLRGTPQPIEFPAVVARAPDGSLTAQAEFDLDRTRWGAIYGSGKFFARLLHHVVNDLVHLHLKLKFEPCN